MNSATKPLIFWPKRTEEKKRKRKRERKKGKNATWLKGAKIALILYIKKWLGTDAMETGFSDKPEGGADKKFTKEMIRRDRKYILEFSPMEFGFQVSGLSSDGEKGNGKGGKGGKKEEGGEGKYTLYGHPGCEKLWKRLDRVRLATKCLLWRLSIHTKDKRK